MNKRLDTAVLAAIVLGCVLLGCAPPDSDPAQTAAPPESSDVEPDAPAGFSEQTKRLLALHKELHSFKDDPEFHQVGFGACCRFHEWQARVEVLRSETKLETIMDIEVVPGDLLILGLEYMQSKGRSTEYTKTMEPLYKAGQSALSKSGG